MSVLIYLFRDLHSDMLRSFACPSKPSIHPPINLSHSAFSSSAPPWPLSRPSRRCQPGSCCSARDGSKPTQHHHTCSLQALSPGLSLLLAGSVVVHTLAGPLLLAPPARASAVVSTQPGPAGVAATATVTHVQPSYTLSDAPSVHAEAEELQWWQHDQQVCDKLILGGRLQQPGLLSGTHLQPGKSNQPCEQRTAPTERTPAIGAAQVWHEIVSPAELSAFLSASQGPPAWPALDSAALSPKLRLVEFYASWCPACKAAAPGMAEVAGGKGMARNRHGPHAGCRLQTPR